MLVVHTTHTHFFNPWSVSCSPACTLQRHHFFVHFFLRFTELDRFFDCFDFLGLLLVQQLAACGRRGLQSASLGRSIFIFLIFADLAGSGFARPPSNCSNPFESTEMLVLFFLAVDFSTHSTHTVVLFHQRALSPTPSFSSTQNFLPLSRARQEPL